jgi:hypothetical protein
MGKKYVAFCVLIIALLIVIADFSANNVNACLDVPPEGGGVVDKTPCDDFTVKLTFNNTGPTSGCWSVNIAFEGDSWSWAGEAQTLSLGPNCTKTLVWSGHVPCCASIDSVARLIVYYGDSFKRLNWWIHVVSCAELAITSSIVE